MAPRKRKTENKHFPTGLFKRKLRGNNRFKYRFPNGKEVLLPAGTQEFEAIEAATIYNQKHRNPTIKILMDYDQYNKPLTQWLVTVKKRVHDEEYKKEIIGKRVYNAFINDLERLDQLHGDVMSKSVNLSHVNDYLSEFTKGASNEVYNRKITFLKKVFSYIRDMSGMETNPAENKKRKPKQQKQRIRLNLDNFNTILAAAPHWLAIAVKLSIQTTHAVNEISIAKYKDCEWFKEPLADNGLKVFGVLRIHRQKVKNKEASRVEIPITQKLKEIIEESRRDNIASPYIVHGLLKRNKGLAEGLTHATQLAPEFISRAFSNLRDELGLYSEMEKKHRPTFHEIRALSIFLYGEIGIAPQERAAHTDIESTKIYMKDHVEWVRVQAAELAV
jgi:integrase